MSVERRQCLNQNDMKSLPKLGIKLDAFQNYTQEACLLECRAETIFAACGCLPYYYPDFSKVWGKSTTCDLDGLKCLAKTLSKSSESLSECISVTSAALEIIAQRPIEWCIPP